MRLADLGRSKQGKSPSRRVLLRDWEVLEDRRLLDGTGKFGGMTVTLEKGVLTIEGTAKNDAVVVAYGAGADGKFGTADDEVLLQNQTDKPLFLKGVLRKIYFNGKDGDDQFRNDTNVPCEAHGGNGKDQLFGGGSTDLLDGGPGDDVCDGRGTAAAPAAVANAQDVVTTGTGHDVVVTNAVNRDGSIPKTADTRVTDFDVGKDKAVKR